ncbi:MAG TPA: alkaline phosphatase [Bryobacteraceae bacterium]|nr:alkaline phosphatase [Bryobacteraceae bacterium]
MKRAVILFFVSLCLWADEPAAKNVILFLGDAGGIATLHAASIHAYGRPGQLFVQHMPAIALSDTSSASEWVSDSAAGMTAIVTGRKTNNGVLSQSDTAVRGKTDGVALKTILEYAEERGLSTGVVSNSPIASATPAACYAHVNDRSKIGEIFAQVLKPRFGDGVDVILGPGRAEIANGIQALGLDVDVELRKKGFRVDATLQPVPPETRRLAVLLDADDLDLEAATNTAVDVLSRNPNGYFLMVESDLHTDKLVRGLERAAAFDQIIRNVASRVSANTLVLFTADHSFDLRIAGKSPRTEPLISGAGAPSKSVVVLGHHSAEEVLVAAQGPGSSRVRGFLSNTDLFQIMLAAYGWSPEQPPSSTPAPAIVLNRPCDHF